MDRSAGQEAIRSADSPLQAIRLADETYKDARDPEWSGKKVTFVEEILRQAGAAP